MEDNQAAERPTRPMLGRRHIVATALAMLDARGVDAFSMRKLGGELGVDPMAVYHYYPNKAALFDAVVEAIYIEIDTRGAVPDAWDEAVATYLYAARTAMRSHPGALALLATRPVNTAPVFALVEVIAGRLARAGARPTDALAMVNCLATYTVGHLLADVGAPVGGPEAPPPDPATLDPSAIPTLVAAMAAGWVFDPDAVFDTGLRAMIAGFGLRYGLADPT
jgi:TetR/AcrR family transcriptional regulator, tetracycline repressor protein